MEKILQTKPDLIAMQEVNQTMTAPPAEKELLEGYVPAPNHNIPVLQDNHAAQAARLLRAAGTPYSWTWLPAKRGYGKYDEGLALFSLGRQIAQVDSFQVSRCSDYKNWRTRKILGVRLEGASDWYYTVHMGWWDDKNEPFPDQWAALERELEAKKREGTVWLLDTYLLASEKDEGITVQGIIDGWRDKAGTAGKNGMRIDHVWCSRPNPVSRSLVFFNGRNGPVVSDHFGVMVETVPFEKGDECL